MKPAAFREHHRKQVHLVKRHLCTRDSLQVSAPFCLQSLVEEGKKGLNEVAEEHTGCKPMAQALNTCFAGELERGCILMKPACPHRTPSNGSQQATMCKACTCKPQSSTNKAHSVRKSVVPYKFLVHGRVLRVIYQREGTVNGYFSFVHGSENLKRRCTISFVFVHPHSGQGKTAHF